MVPLPVPLAPEVMETQVEPEPAAAAQASPAVAVTEIEPVVLLPDGDALVGMKLSVPAAWVMVKAWAGCPDGVIEIDPCLKSPVLTSTE